MNVILGKRHLSVVLLALSACTDTPSPLALHVEDERIALPPEPALPWSREVEAVHRLVRPNLVMEVDELGAHVRRPAGDVSLRTAAIGRRGALQPVPTTTLADGPCLDGPDDALCPKPAARAGDGVVEWWVARSYGAQQAWRLDHKPAGEGDLVMELAVQGARVFAENDAAVFTPPSGPKVHYRDLVARDAAGKVLPSRFETDGVALHIVVDDTDAAWPLVIDPVLTSANIRVAPSGVLNEFGLSVASGQINSDAYVDIVVGARNATGVGGRIYTFHGNSVGTFSTTPTATLTAGAYDCTDNRAGSTLDVQDVNGDGRDDVLYSMSAVPCVGVGAIALHLSGAGGPPASPTRLWDTAYGNNGNVSGAGDVNNDGYNDVAFSDAGQIKVVHGAAAGPGAAITRTIASPGGSGYGSVNAAGDINNDGYDDLMGGLPGAAGGGGAHLFKGAAAGIPATASQTLTVPASSTSFGTRARGVGDLNNDGRADVFVGDPGYLSNDGRAFVYYGGASTLNTTPTTINNAIYQEGLVGIGIGDLEGDGPDDLWIGLREQSGIPHAVYEGAAGGISTTPSNTAIPGYYTADALGDIDGDGFGDFVTGDFGDNSFRVMFGCMDADNDGTCAEAGDCNDNSATVNPGATEIVGNGIDENCNGTETCYDDDDNDGYLDTTGDTRTSTDTDCADANEGTNADPTTDCADTAATRYPGAPEITGNGVDENCDAAEVCFDDDDNDGFLDASGDTRVSADADCADANEGTNTDLTSDCDDLAAGRYPTASEITGNGVDENCNGAEVCFDDDDNDGFLDTSGDTRVSADADCADANEGTNTDLTTDCDDLAAGRYPTAAEITANGIDENCDGAEVCYDDDDNDGFLDTTGDTRASTDADCADANEGTNTDLTTDCADTVATRYPTATEITGNGVDENCDNAEVCFDDDDNDGFLDSTGDTRVSVDADCADANEGTNADLTTDCNDAVATTFPNAAEVIGDGIDQSCNGQELCYDDDDNDGFLDTTADTRTSSDADCSDVNEGTNTDLTTDCDDAAATRYPGATEVTGDGVDQSCDSAEVCFDDDDNDGFLDTSGDTRASADADCADANEGTNVDLTTDCNDAVATIFPNATEVIGDGIDQSCNGQELCYDDDDNDGFLDTTADTRTSSDADCSDVNEGTNTDLTTDCDDAAPGRYPTATEITGNGVDENCNNAEVCFDDDDNDGFLDTTGDTRTSVDADCADANEGTNVDLTTDCDDAAPGRFPTNAEITGDGVDQNCDNAEVCFDDDDNDGFLDATADTRASTDADCADANEGTNADPTTDCDDAAGTVNPGATEVVADGVDQTCDGRELCYADADADGWRVSTTSLSADTDCADPGEALVTLPSTDCADTDPARNPGLVEVAGDGVDADCTGTELCYVDVDDDGQTATPAAPVASADLTCTAAGLTATGAPVDCDDDDATAYVGATEAVASGTDEDCDGRELCWVDADLDGWRTDLTASTADLSCATPGLALTTLPSGDCDDSAPGVNPGAVEDPANGIDDDCTEGLLCGHDVDGDGAIFGTVLSVDDDCADVGEALPTAPADCDDGNANRYPGAFEVTGDGVDEDCDGAELCYLDADQDSFVAATRPTVASADADCADATEALFTAPATDCDDGRATVYLGAPEQLNDGVDQDCDGGDRCLVDGDDDGWLATGAATAASADLDCDDANEGTSAEAALAPDCADDRAEVHPDAVETVGVDGDLDCDGVVTCAVDADLDGEGDLDTTVASTDDDCGDAGEARSTALLDCDDGDITINHAATELPGDDVDQDCDGGELCYQDQDGDGWRSDGLMGSADGDCADAGEARLATPAGDCDDALPERHPTATEVVADGVDSDCDLAELCPVDADGDQQPAALPPISADLDCSVAGVTSSTSPIDCDDASADIYVGAPDVAGDGIDADCDGAESCYADADEDGWRTNDVVASPTGLCDGPGEAPATSPGGDCADADAAVNPGATEVPGDEVDTNCDGLELCWVDADGDGQTASAQITALSLTCAAEGFVGNLDNLDCDDGAALVFVGAVELPGDGVDQDCDGAELCYVDADADGFSIADQRTGPLDCAAAGLAALGAAPGDCDDTDDLTFPGAAERVADAVDSDCDGGELCYVDLDGDHQPSAATPVFSANLSCDDPGEGRSTGNIDCDDADSTVFVGALEGAGDGVDQDCDGLEACYRDADDDGFRVSAIVDVADLTCSSPGLASAAVPGVDCNDADATIYPGAPDDPADGIDQNCDNQVACAVDLDVDGFADATALVFADDGDCTDPGELPEGAPIDCDDSEATTFPGAAELPADFVDSDCDGGELCYADADADGFASTALVASADLQCDGLGEAPAGAPRTDCFDGDATISPAAIEGPGDGVDQDCDAVELCYLDLDADGWRVDDATAESTTLDCSAVGFADDSSQVGDCDDADDTVSPDATEVLADGVDQDCDGGELCYADADDDGWRVDDVVASDDADCDDLGEALATLPGDDCDDADAGRHPGLAEVIGDGIDQDCDGVDAAASCYADADGDGFRTDDAVGSADQDCDDAGEADVSVPDGDCDDEDGSVNPGATELIADGLDQDCDGAELCFIDADGDGLRPDDTTTVMSEDATCDGAGEATGDAPALDCDDTSADADRDGLDDFTEVIDLDTQACNPDSDDDGLNDGREVNDLGTDPRAADSDDGGVSDGQEVSDGTDPLDPTDDDSLVDPPKDSGCGCDTGAPSGLSAALLLAVFGLRRRKAA